MEVYYALLRDGGPRQQAREVVAPFEEAGRAYPLDQEPRAESVMKKSRACAAIRHNLADRRRRWLLARTLWRHFGRRRWVQCCFCRRCRVYHGDPTLGAVSSRRPLRDRSRSVSRVPSLAIHEVSEGRREPQDTANAFQDVGGPRLPELSKGLDVDSGVRHGPEGRHETERRADDQEEHPRETKGPCPFRQVAPRTSGELPRGEGPFPRAGHKDSDHPDRPR